MPPAEHRPATRVVHAGLPEPSQGAPFLPGPTFAAPYHLSGGADAARYGYARYTNPTWDGWEAALGDLEGGRAVAFSSGVAAVSAVLLPSLGPGDVLVAPDDAYPAVRTIGVDHLRPRGVEVRLVPTDEAAYRDALDGATLVWAETPANPGMQVLDVARLAEAVHAAGGRLAVDNTLATPLLQRPLELGADWSMSSGSKHLTGHGDLVLGHVAVRDEEAAQALVDWRNLTGAIPGPFEAWLAHRSLATLDVRLERECANARALAELLAARDDVADVRYPGMGTVLVFDVGSEERAHGFLQACELVAEATSFGGVHSSAERRARWGTDAVEPGVIRFSAGVEHREDLLADVSRALDATHP